MSIIKALCIAFSIYSKIPMPQFEWKDKDMRYHLIFFPFVGAVIGALIYGWGGLCRILELPAFVFALITAAIPLIVTGGFHVDGFMDTMDAFKSYKSGEEKLMIMKDPHIGAFSVIMLAVYGLIYLAAASLLQDESIGVFVLSFILSRILSAIAVLSFPRAKTEGMVHTFSESADSRRGLVRALLIVELLVTIGGMLRFNLILGITTVLCFGLYFLYYYLRTKREFGGITGDTAGYFVTCSEVLAAVLGAVYAVVSGAMGS